MPDNRTDPWNILLLVLDTRTTKPSFMAHTIIIHYKINNSATIDFKVTNHKVKREIVSCSHQVVTLNGRHHVAVANWRAENQN